MKLYLISQNKNNGYDTYDSAVVAADNEHDAARIYPGESNSDMHYDDTTGKWYCVGQLKTPDFGKRISQKYDSDWVSDLTKVKVQYLGEATPGTEAGAILSSFNAG